MTCRQGGAVPVFEGRYLVCAIPFSILRRVEISPPLTPTKRAAIEVHPYEASTRVYVQTRRRSWEDEGWNGFAVTDLPDAISHPTFDLPGPRGILISNLSGHQARRADSLAPEARVAATVAHLDAVFPGLRAQVETSCSLSWDGEEWSRGAYSVLGRGQVRALYPHAAKPEGRVFFAGEHTSPWAAWMQGALASGERAAAEVLAAAAGVR